MKKALKSLLCLWLCTLILAGAAATVVFAAKNDYSNNSQVKNYQNKIAALEKEQKEIKGRLDDVENELYTAQQQSSDISKLIKNTNEQISTAEMLLSDIESQITVKSEEIADTESKIEIKEEEMAITKDKFLELVRVQYENGTPSVIEVIYDADSFSDMLSRVQYMGGIMDYNSKLLDKYSLQRDDLVVLKGELETEKTALEEDRLVQMEYEEELEAKKAELVYQKAVQDELVSALVLSADEIKAEYDAAVKAEQQESDRLKKYLAELAAQEAKNNGTTVNNSDINTGGKLGWPVKKSIRYISSKYGWRTYYYRGQKITNFHRGIDIPAAVGTDIYSVEDGTVIVAQYDSSYGNYILVNHGGGLATLYAHCSKLLKKPGDVVKKGDHIAEMGSTGHSTGSHVHFEVRVNGERVDPIGNGWVVQPK